MSGQSQPSAGEEGEYKYQQERLPVIFMSLILARFFVGTVFSDTRRTQDAGE